MISTAKKWATIGYNYMFKANSSERRLIIFIILRMRESSPIEAIHSNASQLISTVFIHSIYKITCITLYL